MARTTASNKEGQQKRRVLIVGKDNRALLPLLKKNNFEVVSKPRDAELIITYGGDGSLLGADREFPHLPKLAMRSGEYTKCRLHQDEAVLRRVASGRHAATFFPRLLAEVNGQTLVGMNDIVFHNEVFTSAVRYRVKIDGQYYSDEIVGDGLVVATPFGSSAYYRAITNSVFRVGLGLAFNNSTESVNHLVLADSSVIQVDVTRGPAQLVADNNPRRIPIDRGDSLIIKLGGGRAEIWETSTIFCKDCRFRSSRRPAGSRHV